MNRRLSDKDHSVAIRMVEGLRNAAGAFALLALWIVILALVAKEVEPDAHRYAPAEFHGQDIERYRPYPGPGDEEFTARD